MPEAIFKVKMNYADKIKKKCGCFTIRAYFSSDVKH